MAFWSQGKGRSTGKGTVMCPRWWWPLHSSARDHCGACTGEDNLGSGHCEQSAEAPSGGWDPEEQDRAALPECHLGRKTAAHSSTSPPLRIKAHSAANLFSWENSMPFGSRADPSSGTVSTTFPINSKAPLLSRTRDTSFS